MEIMPAGLEIRVTDVAQTLSSCSDSEAPQEVVIAPQVLEDIIGSSVLLYTFPEVLKLSEWGGGCGGRGTWYWGLNGWDAIPREWFNMMNMPLVKLWLLKVDKWDLWDINVMMNYEFLRP